MRINDEKMFLKNRLSKSNNKGHQVWTPGHTDSFHHLCWWEGKPSYCVGGCGIGAEPVHWVKLGFPASWRDGLQSELKTVTSVGTWGFRDWKLFTNNIKENSGYELFHRKKALGPRVKDDRRPPPGVTFHLGDMFNEGHWRSGNWKSSVIATDFQVLSGPEYLWRFLLS